MADTSSAVRSVRGTGMGNHGESWCCVRHVESGWYPPQFGVHWKSSIINQYCLSSDNCYRLKHRLCEQDRILPDIGWQLRGGGQWALG